MLMSEYNDILAHVKPKYMDKPKDLGIPYIPTKKRLEAWKKYLRRPVKIDDKNVLGDL